MFRCTFVIVGVILLGGCGRTDTYFEDTTSHSVKVKRGLLSTEEVVYTAPSFDPKTANWAKGVSLAARTPITDEDVFVVSVRGRLFAVEVIEQRLQPETMAYRWKAIKTSAINTGFGRKIVLPGIEIQWSYFAEHQGRIYCEPFFLASKPSYEIASPYLRKRIEDISEEDVLTLRFTPFPWEI
jgi:hypothetical protein